jgi:hypothetical protein
MDVPDGRQFLGCEGDPPLGVGPEALLEGGH